MQNGKARHHLTSGVLESMAQTISVHFAKDVKKDVPVFINLEVLIT